MNNARDLFHKISYIQYPLMFAGMFFIAKPFFNERATIWSDYNMALIFYGLGLSVSTLQDTTKSQNKVSQRIWENPQKSKLFLIYIGCMAGFFLIIGVVAALQQHVGALNELSFGLISLSVGLLGILKGGLEMAENHQAKAKTASPE